MDGIDLTATEKKDGNGAKYMDIWDEFRKKIKDDTLTESDFAAEMRAFLQPLLCGERAAARRRKFLEAPYDVYESARGISVVLHCLDDDYRLDFSCDSFSWRLAFMECITLPVLGMEAVPYSEFAPLGKKEAFIRREKEISQLIRFYLKFKELVGKEEALMMFCDGRGEFLCARSWVPFYSDGLSYIAYCAWYESRMNGETVAVQEFQENRCVVVFYNHIWRNVYFMAAHLNPIIEYAEYMKLFESIWKDRAENAGWKIDFIYKDGDTTLIFNKRPTDGANGS